MRVSARADDWAYTGEGKYPRVTYKQSAVPPNTRPLSSAYTVGIVGATLHIQNSVNRNDSRRSGYVCILKIKPPKPQPKRRTLAYASISPEAPASLSALAKTSRPAPYTPRDPRKKTAPLTAGALPCSARKVACGRKLHRLPQAPAGSLSGRIHFPSPRHRGSTLGRPGAYTQLEEKEAARARGYFGPRGGQNRCRGEGREYLGARRVGPARGLARPKGPASYLRIHQARTDGGLPALSRVLKTRGGGGH